MGTKQLGMGRDKERFSSIRKVSLCSPGNPSKDRQRFVDSVLISAPDWSIKLPNFENLLETPFEFGLRMPDFAKLYDRFTTLQLFNGRLLLEIKSFIQII